MPDRAERFQHDGFYLIPGPAWAEEPMYTHAVDEFGEYPHSEIAHALLAQTEVSETHPPHPDWFEWRAKWREDSDIIHINMFPDTDHFESLETGEPVWSGCNLTCNRRVGHLVEIWQAVHREFPGVWLCDGGAYREIGSRMFTPKTFLTMPIP